MRWLFAPLLLVLACDEPEPEPTGPPSDTRAIGWLELQDPGAAPRRQPRIAFEVDREERATLVFDSVFEPAGHPRVEEQLELELALTYEDSSRVRVEVRDARTTAGDIPAIGTTVGTTARVVFHPTGATEEPAVSPPAGANARAATYVRGALAQVLPALVPAFPDRAIGEGARWGGEGLSFRLVSDDGERLVIERRTGLDREEHLPDGRSIEASEEQVYRIDARLDRVARSVEAELLTRGDDGTRRETDLRFRVR